MMEQRSKRLRSPSTPEVDELLVQQLRTVINEIGVARFAGRVQSGLIDSDAGYEALSQFSAAQEKRPFLSEVADILFSRRPPSHR